MKTTTKNLSDTKVEIKVTLDHQDLAAAEQKALARLAADVKVPGFRKGKVPADVAAQHIPANELSAATLDHAVRTSVPAAFQEAGKNPLAIPQVEVTKYVPGESAEYKATAEILPDIKLGDYQGLKVKKTTPRVTAKEIDEVVENIRSAYAEKKVAKKKAALGDEVTIDFEGSKDGVKFDGGSAKDFKLVLGSGQFIPGFEDGVVGHESGDRFDLKLTFPKDYHNKDLAGQQTNFNVLLKQVSEIIKPELNDDFAKKCGPFKTVDDLKNDIKQNLKTQNEAKADEKFKDDLVTALVKASKVTAPEILIKDQLRFIKDDITRNAAAQGLSFEDYLKQIGQDEKGWEKEASKVAEVRVKSSLCLQVLARDQKITVDDATVDAKVAELREVYKQSPEALKNLKDPNVRQDIKNRLTIEKTIDFLVKANS